MNHIGTDRVVRFLHSVVLPIAENIVYKQARGNLYQTVRCLFGDLLLPARYPKFRICRTTAAE